MFNSFDKIRELLALVTDETPQWEVSQYWGTDGGWRTFGTGLARAKAERRATLVARIIPEKYTRIRED
jgi:hypothetical protein